MAEAFEIFFDLASYKSVILVDPSPVEAGRKRLLKKTRSPLINADERG
jgi:hypothetical protein